MLPIACLTAACLQMHLGIGYIVSRTSSDFIYYNMSKREYLLCQGNGGYYNCGPLDEEYANYLEDRKYGSSPYGRYQ